MSWIYVKLEEMKSRQQLNLRNREDGRKIMPFQMTHLHIGKNLYRHFPETIRDLSHEV